MLLDVRHYFAILQLLDIRQMLDIRQLRAILVLLAIRHVFSAPTSIRRTYAIHRAPPTRTVSRTPVKFQRCHPISNLQPPKPRPSLAPAVDHKMKHPQHGGTLWLRLTTDPQISALRTIKHPTVHRRQKAADEPASPHPAHNTDSQKGVFGFARGINYSRGEEANEKLARS